MGRGTSIAQFLVPADRLIEECSKHLASGRGMLLRNFMNILFEFMNSNEAWGALGSDSLRPQISVAYETLKTESGVGLVVTVLDRIAVSDGVKRLKNLPLGQQTLDAIRRACSSADVPMLEFSRAGTMIIEASFELQPDPLLQSIQLETAERGRKDKVETSNTPDLESRGGMALPHDIIPISILEGDMTMIGNFVIKPFDRIWVEFFGASSISGIFNIISQSDRVESGKFTSQFHLISEGIDPLNTRFRFTDAEFTESKRLATVARKKKK